MIWQPVPIYTLLEWGEGVSRHPAAMLGLVLFQSLMLIFALPGTLMLWVVAPIYQPPVATLMLTAGSVTGAMGAYWISRSLTGSPPSEDSSGRVVTLLRRRGDLLTQLVLRILPGFPHSVINYAAGLLGLPFKIFVSAALLGLTVKWLVYTSAVHALVEVGTGAEKLGVDSVTPLLILAIFVGVGAWVKNRIQAGRSQRMKASREN